MALPSISNTLEGYVSIPINYAFETASQVFKKGDPLIISGSNDGRVKLAADEPEAGIVGYANADASGTTGESISYTPSNASGIVFTARIGTSVDTPAGVSAEADLLEIFPLRIGTNLEWFIDKTDKTEPCVQVIGFEDEVGTLLGRVKFKFLPATIALIG